MLFQVTSYKTVNQKGHVLHGACTNKEVLIDPVKKGFKPETGVWIFLQPLLCMHIDFPIS